MKDQAHTLRRIIKGSGGRHLPQVLSVTSGKGGVGKTSIVVNMAILMASQGKKVLVLDADLGLANIDVMLGLSPKHNIKHVLEGQCSLEDILLEGPGGIKIIPASSGIQELVDLSHEQQITLMNSLDYFDQDIDYMLIDTGAGISRNVMYFNCAAQRIIVVATAEPTSITDAYALIKVLRRRYGIKRFNLIVNNVSSNVEGDQVARKLTMVCERFLGDVSLDMLGSIPNDTSITECIKGQKAFVGVNPTGESSKRLGRIVRNLESHCDENSNGNIQFFFKRMLLNQAKGSNYAGYSISRPY
ncbi:MAG TPA: MinD/ParA family protein [Deltaproteobacteria bacterium]|nr:MinD/ParA family protein [Deltaproteobacteria bacterium]